MASCFSFGQDDIEKENKETSEKTLKKEFQKLGYAAIDFSQPFPTGDNFFGLGMKGDRGFNIKTQLFVYKHIYLSGTIGSSYFSVTNKSVVGNYNKTTASHQFISIGYEFLPLTNIKTGLSLILFGNSDYKNKSMTNSREAFQNDDGRVKGFEIYFDYMINDEFAIYLNYSYRDDKMDIQTAPEIQSLFNNATFHNVGIGVKLYFGQSDIISGF